MVSFESRLTPPQQDVLRAFFERERGFFLTGGGALAAYNLGHGETDDLDLFTASEEAFDRGRAALAAAAQAVGGRIATRRDTPGYQRFVVSRGDEGVVVDLVWERVPAAFPDKNAIACITVGPIDEILVNKITTIVSRAEERDLVDLLFLERAGFPIERGLSAALEKDGGCTPATLAWVLAELSIPDSAKLAAGVSAVQMRAFIADLIVRLRRAAAPPGI